MRSRLGKAHRWIADEVRWHGWALETWRQLKRLPSVDTVPPYVGTLTNEQIDGDDWTLRPTAMHHDAHASEPEHPGADW